MRLTLLTASHVMQQCKKSEYFVTRLTADHSKVRPTPPLICNLRCQSCASHAHVNDLPGDNTARNALYFSSVHLAAISSYADQRDMSVTHGGRSPRYGTKRPSVPSSADIICLMEKFVAHMLTYCDPHISQPPILRGQNSPKFFNLYASTYGKYNQK